ncbi:MAG TPA: M23 family metallopeptidase [Bryobacteraceae bacterium]|jgi:murein DD-endopeptidase MepM/ murein hydrolase activator NlpD|nr:M23 family metallopeptidase [Bryobacteraceae bacterium]
MKQHYFVVVLAHSLHGRLRRVHIPHQALYLVVALALFGTFSLFGAVSSYLRMTWKVSNYNSLRSEVGTLRDRLRVQQREIDEKQEKLASLELMASEVSVALGLKRQLEGTADISDEGPLVPSFNESIEEYNFLKSASFSRLHHEYARTWQKNIVPSMWPVNGVLLSRFGERTDPFSGEGAIHAGVDISAQMGTPVHAAADGIVSRAEYYGGYGRLVVIDHGNGMSTRYGHLSRFDVVPGQEVRRGDVIAFSGNSGRATSPHLHFEVRLGGAAVNPHPYLIRSAMMPAGHSDLPF